VGQGTPQKTTCLPRRQSGFPQAGAEEEKGLREGRRREMVRVEVQKRVLRSVPGGKPQRNRVREAYAAAEAAEG